MALTNFTEYKNKKAVVELYCSVELIGGVDGELIFLSSVNIFLSFATFLGNTLILVALYKDHPPSKLLYRNLAITDLCVGIIMEPLAVIYWTSVVNERYRQIWVTANFPGFSSGLGGGGGMCRWDPETLNLYQS